MTFNTEPSSHEPDCRARPPRTERVEGFGSFSNVPVTRAQSKVVFQGWMAKFCIAPPGGDVDTCCLAFWVPSAMYGKTHWRLARIAKGQDHQNSSWKSKFICNGACWSAQLLSCIGLECLCIGCSVGCESPLHSESPTYYSVT